MKTTDTTVGKAFGVQTRTDNGNLICEAFTDPDTGCVHVYVYSKNRNDLKVIAHIE